MGEVSLSRSKSKLGLAKERSLLSHISELDCVISYDNHMVTISYQMSLMLILHFGM